MNNKFSRKHRVATPKQRKEQYNMHGGVPIWQHLKNNGVEHYINLQGINYGPLAEQIGLKEIKILTREKGFLSTIFPDISIIAVKRRREKRYGDYCLEISYTSSLERVICFGKKVLIMEIKYGLLEITQQQIKRYSEYIINPSAYFRKADEVRVFFIFIKDIDTMNYSAKYTISEFDRQFANKIFNAVPIQNVRDTGNIFSLFKDEV